MIIHVVDVGDTLRSISEKYQISVERLIMENGITNPNNLVLGQTIIIVYPLTTYTVEEGDTLSEVAEKYQVSEMHILRNNPQLSDRALIPNETIIISYDATKIRSIQTTGYAYPFINESVLKKTLPYLTYLTIFNNRVTKDGEIIDVQDENLIRLAKEYGVAPVMFLSTLSSKGIGNAEVVHSILTNPEIQDRLINNIIDKLKTKGYYGLNLYLQYLRPENHVLAGAYVKKLSRRLHEEGFQLIISFTPRTMIERTEVDYESIDMTDLVQDVDGLLILSYDWAYTYGPPASATSMNIVRELLKMVTSMVPAEKVYLGLPVIGYDWELPYIPAYTIARSINFNTAIEIAVLTNAIIHYNEVSQAPYFFYLNEIQDLHIVWFKDARSIDAYSSLVPEYGLQGMSIWNIMKFFHQLWLIINNTFEITKIDISTTASVHPDS